MSFVFHKIKFAIPELISKTAFVMYLSNTKTIVFITGAFISHSCWKEWIIFFENEGYKTVAPPWPFKNESPEVLRSQNADKIASLRLQYVLDYYIEIIEKLPEKPILVGHSYGGLLTQLLMQKELGAAGICIHTFPPCGKLLSVFSFFKALWKPQGYFTSVKKSYLISFEEWQNRFTNEMSFEEQKATYEKFAVPESKLLLRDIMSKTAKIDFNKKHEPLLFISGSADAFIQSKNVYSNFRKYKNFQSITCYKDFNGKNHLVLNQAEWQIVAKFMVRWLDKVL